MLLISRTEVEELLDVDALIDALAGGMSDLSAGRASVPNRVGARVDELDGLLLAMPGYAPSSGALVAKLVSLFPRNAGGELPTHQAVIAVFDPETGRPDALLDGEAITATRTGAGSALATRLLAREDATTLAILGTGVQARSHARAVTRVRPFEELRVAGRHRSKAEALAEELAGELDLPIVVAGSWEEACQRRGRDLRGHPRHRAGGQARVAVRRHARELGRLQPAGPRAGRRDGGSPRGWWWSPAQAALAPVPAGSNDLLQPMERGLIGPDHIQAEIGELVDGSRPGRMTQGQITLYKSVGVAVQDAVAAALVLGAARARGAGQNVEL